MSTALAVAAPSSSCVAPDASSPAPSAALDAGTHGSSSPARNVKTRRYRAGSVKPPKDAKVYKVVTAALALRAQGLASDEIAEHLGMKAATIRQYLYRANKRGWINIHSFVDPHDQIDFVLASKTVRNVDELLDKRDKDVTIEAAKGFGLFKQHQVVKNDGPANVGLALSVKVEMPPAILGAATLPQLPATTLGGSRGADIPIDAEILETSTEK